MACPLMLIISNDGFAVRTCCCMAYLPFPTHRIMSHSSPIITLSNHQPTNPFPPPLHFLTLILTHAHTFPPSENTLLPLRTPTPHILHQPVPLRQPIQTVVALAHGPHEPAQRVDLVLPRVAAVLVDLADGDLHRGVVFGFYDAVGRGAFAGDVAGLGEFG